MKEEKDGDLLQHEVKIWSWFWQWICQVPHWESKFKRTVCEISTCLGQCICWFGQATLVAGQVTFAVIL